MPRHPLETQEVDSASVSNLIEGLPGGKSLFVAEGSCLRNLACGAALGVVNSE